LLPKADGNRIIADIFRNSDQNSDIKFMQKCKHLKLNFYYETFSAEISQCVLCVLLTSYF